MYRVRFIIIMGELVIREGGYTVLHVEAELVHICIYNDFFVARLTQLRSVSSYYQGHMHWITPIPWFSIIWQTISSSKR